MMTDIDREIHRILATVRKINELGIACLDCTVSSYGFALQINEWLGTAPGENLAIGRRWIASENELTIENLQRINRELRAVLSGAYDEQVAA